MASVVKIADSTEPESRFPAPKFAADSTISIKGKGSTPEVASCFFFEPLLSVSEPGFELGSAPSLLLS
jgi:hypothetical protein